MVSFHSCFHSLVVFSRYKPAQGREPQVVIISICCGFRKSILKTSPYSVNTVLYLPRRFPVLFNYSYANGGGHVNWIFIRAALGHYRVDHTFDNRLLGANLCRTRNDRVADYDLSAVSQNTDNDCRTRPAIKM